MTCGLPLPALRATGLVVAVLAMASPACATRAPEARLVHCGEQTCLRLSGHRAQPTVAIRVAGQDLAVEGGRAWRVTVPLATARAWATMSGSSLSLTMADPEGGAETTQAVSLPPGALGRRIELSALVVHAR